MKVLRVTANSAKKALSHKENGWVRKFNISSESWLAWLKKKKSLFKKTVASAESLRLASLCCKMY